MMELRPKQSDYFDIFKNAYENFNRMRLLIAQRLIESGLAEKAWEMKMKNLNNALVEAYENEKEHFIVDLYRTDFRDETGVRFESDSESTLERLDEPVIIEKDVMPYIAPEYLKYERMIEELVEIMDTINAEVVKYDNLIPLYVQDEGELNVLDVIRRSPINYLIQQDGP